MQDYVLLPLKVGILEQDLELRGMLLEGCFQM